MTWLTDVGPIHLEVRAAHGRTARNASITVVLRFGLIDGTNRIWAVGASIAEIIRRAFLIITANRFGTRNALTDVRGIHGPVAKTRCLSLFSIARIDWQANIGPVDLKVVGGLWNRTFSAVLAHAKTSVVQRACIRRTRFATVAWIIRHSLFSVSAGSRTRDAAARIHGVDPIAERTDRLICIAGNAWRAEICVVHFEVGRTVGYLADPARIAQRCDSVARRVCRTDWLNTWDAWIAFGRADCFVVAVACWCWTVDA